MEEKFIAAWQSNRAAAALMGIRMRPIDENALKNAKRILSGTRLSDGFNELAAKGVAVIMVSSELPEVLGMSDRIAVVHEGKITGILNAADADQAKVMTLATGGSL